MLNDYLCSRQATDKDVLSMLPNDREGILFEQYVLKDERLGKHEVRAEMKIVA